MFPNVNCCLQSWLAATKMSTSSLQKIKHWIRNNCLWWESVCSYWQISRWCRVWRCRVWRWFYRKSYISGYLVLFALTFCFTFVSWFYFFYVCVCILHVITASSTCVVTSGHVLLLHRKRWWNFWARGGDSNGWWYDWNRRHASNPGAVRWDVSSEQRWEVREL